MQSGKAKDLSKKRTRLKTKYRVRRALVAVLALAFIALCAGGVYHALTATGDNLPRHEIETSREIDFNAPDIVVHTADDGIAVVGVARPTQTLSNSNNLAAQHTHSGFTLPVQMDGESIGVLTIPDIGLSVRVYEGEDEMELMEKGVALFRHTSSWYGNVGLSAHNVNLDGSPGYFLHIYRLHNGAVINYTTAFGTREYAVESITEISQYDWSLLSRTEDNRLTLITCITGRPDLRLAVVATERALPDTDIIAY